MNHKRISPCLLIAALGVCIISPRPACCDDPKPKAQSDASQNPQDARKAIAARPHLSGDRRPQVAEGSRLRDLPPRHHDRLGPQRGESPGLCGQGGSAGRPDQVDQGPVHAAHRQATRSAGGMAAGERAGDLPGDDVAELADPVARRRSIRSPCTSPGTRRRTGPGRCRRRRTERRPPGNRARPSLYSHSSPGSRTCRPTRRKPLPPAPAATRRPSGWQRRNPPTRRRPTLFDCSTTFAWESPSFSPASTSS